MIDTTPTAEPSPRNASGRPTATVLIVDTASPATVAGLERLGCRVEHDPDLGPDTLTAAMERIEPDIVVVRSTKIPAAALHAAGHLSLIVRSGAGYDNIDVAAASTRGVFIANCPGKNALAVAELTWALILACDRRVPDQTIDLRNGIWDKKLYAKARGLHGRTLGVVGLGRIGEAVVVRGRAFGMRVVAWSRRLTPERAQTLGVEFAASPLEVARAADVVTLHVAATPETRHLVDRAFCAALKDGATFVNTTRGSVVDEDALTEAIRHKGIRVGLDVYADEPTAGDKTFTDPIVGEAGVVGTHHVGASTDQAQEAIAAETLRVVETYLDSGEVLNCVNRAAASAATCLLTVRHLNRPGVLAQVFQVLSDAGINVEEMENIIYEGARAACARIRLARALDATGVEAIRRSEHILSVSVG